MSPSLLSQKQSAHIHFLHIIKLMVLSRRETRKNMLFSQMKVQNWFSHVVLSSSLRHILPYLCSLALTSSSIYQTEELAAAARPDCCFVWLCYRYLPKCPDVFVLWCSSCLSSFLFPPNTSLLKPHTLKLTHMHVGRSCMLLFQLPP